MRGFASRRAATGPGIWIVEGDRSSGAVYMYTALTDSFTGETRLNDFLSFFAIDGVGSRLLVNTYSFPNRGTFVVEAGLVNRAVIPGDRRGIAIDLAGVTGYRVQDSSVEVLDVVGARVVRSIALLESLGPSHGVAALNREGTTLTVLTANGISTVSVLPPTVAALPAGSGLATGSLG